MEPVSDQRIYSNRYQVTHLIARGGMAMVYRAHDMLLNRYVALKILYPELSVDPNFVERFRREAQAAANLSHPNIVPIFDWGEDNGTYFIVMELIEGTSLDALLRESRTLSAAKSAQVAAQVASALSYAHRQGVVHRDVKPGNILLTNDGQVKVTDFGIAQAVSTEDNLTVAGSVMGTATYFSPEQAEGALVDGRSDVYSLGVVLYELLAGRPPFIGETPVAVATKHVREAVVSPRQYNPSLPADLESIVLHALAKRPADRYQTAEEMRADLLRFTEGLPVLGAGRASGSDDTTRAVAIVAPTGERTQAVPVMTGPRTDVRRRRRGPRPWVYAVLALVLVLAGVGAYLLASHKEVVKMPNVVGLSVGAAESNLREVGLSILSTQFVHSSEPVGTVLRTDPKHGTKVTKGQGVELYLSEGQSTTPVQIPAVVGDNLSVAEATLDQAGLSYKVDWTSTASAGALPDVVLNQTPSGKTTGHTGETVTILVLSPNSNYPVPSVKGDTITAAAAALGASGLTVASTQGSTCSDTYASGLVVSTDPAAGQLVASGATIELIVSSGFCNVTVPLVAPNGSTPGDSQAAATAAIEAAGLVPSYSYGTALQCTGVSDEVIAQTPAGGTSAPYDSTVDLTYCPPATTP